LLKIVIVRCVDGAIPFRVFFSMGTTLTVPELLGVYSRRWSIEVLFRELKQLFGFADSSARKKAAVLRVAPFVGLCYTTPVLWCCSSADALQLAALRPVPGTVTSAASLSPTSSALPGVPRGMSH